MFKVNMAGYMVHESRESKIVRPSGSGDWLFLYFPVPMAFFDRDGSVTVSKKDACVIYAPGDYHSFSGSPEFENSYVHFSCDDSFMDKFTFETAKLFYPSSAVELNRITKRIKEEAIEGGSLSSEMVSAYITQLLITAERSFGADNDELKESFSRLRYEMLENYSENRSMAEMAAKACMSKSRFYERYKAYFGQSPKQELIKIRMENARVLLTNEKLTVAEVAGMVGFESPEHFSRYYTKYFGTSPKSRTKHHI